MPSTGRATSLAANLGLALVSLLAISVAAELALRYVLLRNLNPFAPDAALGYRLKPDFEGTYPRTRVRTDSLQRRVPAAFDGTAGGRYLFVGDSVTFGFGVLAEESYPEVFATLTGAPGQAANTAVPGYNLDQALALLEENLTHAWPRLIVYGLVVNDLYDADSPLGYEDIDPHASRVRSGGFLARSLLIAFVQRRWNRIADRFDEPDEPDEPRSGAVVIADFDRELAPATVVAFDDQWGRLEAIALRTGVPTAVVVFPFRQQLEDRTTPRALQEFVARRCVDSALRCLDPFDVLAAAQGDSLYNGTSSFHFNPRGHRLIAEWLVAQLADVLR